MRTTRILAMLLCVMMVLTMVPVIAGAAETTYSTIEEITGYNLLTVKTYDFTAENAESLYTGSGSGCDSNEVTFDTTDGMTLSGTAPRWRFGSANSSSLGVDRAIYFRAKVAEGGSAMAYFHVPDTTADSDAYEVSITPEGISAGAYSTGTQMAAFVPGTDWAEYLIAKTETGMAVYARQDGFVGGKWVYVLDVTATTGISKHSAVYFTMCGSVQKLTIYDTNMVFTTKDTLADITGPAYAAQNFVFRPGFDVLLNGGVFPQGEAPVIDENGMKLEEGKNWRFYQNGDGWSPLDNGDAAVFRAKVSDSDDVLEVLMKSPLDDTNKAYLVIKETGVVVNNNADVDMKFNFVPGTDWAEYLVQANDNGGYDVWVKAALFGNDKWYLLAETTAYNNENGRNHRL